MTNTTKQLVCTDRRSLPLPLMNNGYRPGDKPAIVIIDAEKAIALARLSLTANPAQNHAARLHTAKAFISSGESPDFEICEMYFVTEPQISSGRHRTIALASLGFQTIPYVTSEKMAAKLADFWGSIKTASREYDLSKCVATLIIGHA